MFENTTEFDFDDDVILGTSFKPTKCSTQEFKSQAPKRLTEELDREKYKKFKCDEEHSNVVESAIMTDLSRNLFSDTFTSPNRVLKRKFPGPAGLLPEIGASNKSILQLYESEQFENEDEKDVPLLSQQSNSVFEDGPWKEMSKDFHVQKGDSLFGRFNIKWIKKQALKQLLSHKAPFLAAIIQNLEIIDGKIPTINVVLKDSTGDIRGTILHSLYEEYSTYFKIGSVLVLKHFGVLSAGHNNHCVTITSNNLVSIYSLETSTVFPNNRNIYGESSRSCNIKKIVIQDYNVEDILKKYNEEVAAYTEEKQKKINFGNLKRNSSNEERIRSESDRFSRNDKFLPPVGKLQSNCSSIATSVRTTNNAGNANTIGQNRLGSASFEIGNYDSSMKKKFVFSSNKAIVNDKHAMLVKDNHSTPESCSSIVNSNQISVTLENKEHAEIWKNLLQDVDTDSLFDDF